MGEIKAMISFFPKVVREVNFDKFAH